MNGKKIWAVIDCSFRTDDGITIIDLKTGGEAPLEMYPYSFHVMQCMGLKNGK